LEKEIEKKGGDEQRREGRRGGHMRKGYTKEQFWNPAFGFVEEGKKGRNEPEEIFKTNWPNVS